MALETTNRRRVLFVDDDPSFLEMIERIMGVWGTDKWELFLAESPGKALSIIQKHKVNLVVVDLQMPVVDGIQFLNLLNRKHPTLQKVVLTGFASDENRSECLSKGAELFLEKPKTIDGMESIFATLTELARWQPEEGFRGVMRRVGLQDIVQMECLNRNSSILEISNESSEGRIFIKEGVIVHAHIGTLTGEEAFNEILSFPGGEFQHSSYQDPPEESIQNSWEFLLMEAARKKDEILEAKSKAEKEDQPAPEPNRIPSSPEKTTNTFEEAQPSFPNPSFNTINSDDVFPTQVDEMLVCSNQGDVLYQWQCKDSEKRIHFLEFLSKKSSQIAEVLPLGSFDRLEVMNHKSQLVAQIDSSKGVIVRSSKGS